MQAVQLFHRLRVGARNDEDMLSSKAVSDEIAMLIKICGQACYACGTPLDVE